MDICFVSQKSELFVFNRLYLCFNLIGYLDTYLCSFTTNFQFKYLRLLHQKVKIRKYFMFSYINLLEFTSICPFNQGNFVECATSLLEEYGCRIRIIGSILQNNYLHSRKLLKIAGNVFLNTKNSCH